MRLTTPTEITDVLWEGNLAPPQIMRSTEMAQATIGLPFQWPDGALLGDKWQPPLGANRYHLVRLAFSLRTAGRAKITSADFCLSLSPQGGKQGVVFDAYPREQLEEQALPITLGLEPDFKFGAVEASLAKAETTIDFGRAVPVIRTSGLQEASFCWRYAEHPKHPLTGSRQMYAVIALPPNLPTALATLSLTVTQADHVGLIRLTAPDTAQTKLRWVVGQR